MATYTKVKLSGAPVGNIPSRMNAFGFATPHVTGTSATIQDEVWLWVSDMNGTTGGIVQIQFDNPAYAGSPVRFYTTVPANSTVLVVAGLPVSGTGAAGTELFLSDYTGAGNIFAWHGYVNRITP